MNELSKYLVEQILLEEPTPIKKTVVVYVGRFQPFHKGHYATYSHLVKKFGKDNVYIGTSNKTEKPKSPFNFKEKKQIMTTMFGVPSNKIVEVKNPYAPTEVLKNFDEKSTAFVTVVGEKDASRLGGKYFEKYNGNPTEGYKDRGYVYVAPSQSNPISGTDVRVGLGSGTDDQKKNFFTDRAYPKFNKTIYSLITNKLQESCIRLSKTEIEDLIIERNAVGLSAGDYVGVDDGPNTFLPSFRAFNSINLERAKVLGWEVIQKFLEDDFDGDWIHYPEGPVSAVSFFPAGVIGKTTSTNQVDIYVAGAYDMWYKQVTKDAALMGWSVVDKQLEKDDLLATKDSVGDYALEVEFNKDTFNNFMEKMDESITLPVKVGDTILTGRFKNKKTVVKTIGKDEHGMPTINGKKVVTFRLVNEGFEAILESNWPKSKLSTQHDKDFDHHLNYRLSKKFKGNFEVIGFDLYHNGKKLFTIDKRDTYNSVIRKTLHSLKESVNEIAGTSICCEKCNHSWDIEAEDTEKYLCHSCGWDSQKQEYDVERYNEWLSSNPTMMEEALSAGQRAARRWAFQKNRKLINLKKQRTAIRKKPYAVLYKKAYKLAYLYVRKEWTGRLFGSTPYDELTIPQKKRVSQMVQRKKKKILKLAKFRFLPALKQKEAEKFKGQNTEPNIFQQNEMSMAQLRGVEKYAEKQLSPEDIEFTKHFFDRLNDPRNGKEISDAELTGFFKRLSKHKKQFKDFLEKYKQIVVKDKRYDINIPFVKTANQIIAKTVMRKNDFKTSSPTFTFEGEKIPGGLAQGMDLKDVANKHQVDIDDLNKEFQMGIKVEMEHTTDRKVAQEIALDHLFEDPKYYTKLQSIEETIKKVGDDWVVYPKDGGKRLGTHKTYKSALRQLHAIEMSKHENLMIGYPDQEWMDNHEKEIKKLRKQLDKMNEGILTEGGAYGHMNHPFDTEINLTFGQLKDIVNRALDGNLELAREKTDGQALAISWVGGRLVAARNKGHLKNKGAGALDIKGVATKFAGRGELEKAYNFAMKDLSDAIKSLSEPQRKKIFKDGSCFMNLEVIYPTSVNVIPYGQPLLVFHGTMEYDENGTAIGENQEAARILAGMIKQINKDVQDNYTIQGPPVLSLPKKQELSSQKGKFNGQISKLQKEFGLKDTDGVAEYHQAWWSNFVDKNSPSTLDNKTKMGLVKRWAFGDKGFRIDNKNITDEKVLQWAQKTDKEDQAKITKQNLMKFEDIFLGVGAEVLQFTSSVLTVNPDKAIRDMKKRLDQTIKDVKKSGDPKKIEKLKLELRRLMAIGGPDKIVPNEGIVFVYQGKTFKLTGAFASLNQLLGIFYS